MKADGRSRDEVTGKAALHVFKFGAKGVRKVERTSEGLVHPDSEASEVGDSL